jgi:drug/metabolite transporter (DMT)-like permease
MMSLQHLPATIVGLVATAEPPLAALAAFLWLDETLAAVQIAGGLVVLLGIALAQSAR